MFSAANPIAVCIALRKIYVKGKRRWIARPGPSAPRGARSRSAILCATTTLGMRARPFALTQFAPSSARSLRSQGLRRCSSAHWQVCPNPQCNLVCEKPPDCDTHPTLPPPKDGETIVGSGAANDGLARFESGPWGQCSSTCGSGAQARDVHCNTHHDEDCEGLERPSTSRPCQDYSGCQYATSEWSQCSARCGPGTQTRRVGCAGKRCTGKAPLSSQRCDGDAPECHSCNAVVFGGPNFDGWSLEFGPGEYTVADMEAKGAKCDDISSMKVYGLFCRVAVFQFGDFNGAYSGWQANFGPGFYDREKLVDGGARDNDISSLRVSRIGGVASSSFSNPFRNGSNPLNNGASSFPLGGKKGMGWNPFGSAAPLAVLFPLAIALVS
mmetsp:Transcript_23752/g.53862  ORF Transcript_23752/g.53862 Transcript_23752/m.53862 type:complete len:383 (+) Transcript_23752:549-1697(+)